VEAKKESSVGNPLAGMMPLCTVVCSEGLPQGGGSLLGSFYGLVNFGMITPHLDPTCKVP
jgi:hypothetical protein